MQLKRYQDVHYLELARIELPFFARQWVETHVGLNDFGMSRIAGLDTVIWDPHDHQRHVLDDYTYSRLLQRVAQAEVLLIHDYGSEPMIPLVKRMSGENGELWRIDDSLSHEQRFNAERMLAYAESIRGLWQPVEQPEPDTRPSAPAKQAQSKEITVTNPRWEHVDEQRAKDSPDTTMAGDRVTLMVNVTGIADRTLVTFKIVDTSISPPGRIGVVRGKVTDGVGSAEWKVRSPYEEAKVEFTGEARRITSEQAEIPVISALSYLFSF